MQIICLQLHAHFVWTKLLILFSYHAAYCQMTTSHTWTGHCWISSLLWEHDYSHIASALFCFIIPEEIHSTTYIILLNPSSMCWVCLRIFPQTDIPRILPEGDIQMPEPLQLAPFNTKEHQTFSKRPLDVLFQPLEWVPSIVLSLCRVHKHRRELGCRLTDNQPHRRPVNLSLLPPRFGRMAVLLQTPHQSACWPHFNVTTLTHTSTP